MDNKNWLFNFAPHSTNIDKFIMHRISYLLFLVVILTIACNNQENDTTTEPTQDKRLEYLTRQIEKDTSNAGLYYQRAMFYFNNKANNLAIKDIDRAIAKDSSVLKYWFTKADILLRDLQSKDAIAVLRKAGNRFPDSDEAHIKLAHFQFIVKQYLPALTNLNVVIKRNPQNPKAFMEKALIYDEIGDTANAMKNYQRVTELNADNRAAWIAMGDILANQNNKIALKMYQNAIDIAPQKKDAYLAIAYYYHQNGKLKSAKEEYKSIIKKFPQYPPAHFNLGLLYLEQDSVKKAYNAFNTTILVDPASGDAYLYRGISSKLLGDTASAKEDFIQAWNLLPKDDNRATIELNALK